MADEPRWTPFEQQVLEDVLAGRSVGENQLRAEGERRQVVSARLIRTLVMWPADQSPPRRIHLEGIAIDGDLDLSYVTWRGLLRLRDCCFRGAVDLSHADIEGRLEFDHSVMNELNITYCRVNGPVYARHAIFRRGCTAWQRTSRDR